MDRNRKAQMTALTAPKYLEGAPAHELREKMEGATERKRVFELILRNWLLDAPIPKATFDIQNLGPV